MCAVFGSLILGPPLNVRSYPPLVRRSSGRCSASAATRARACRRMSPLFLYPTAPRSGQHPHEANDHGVEEGSHGARHTTYQRRSERIRVLEPHRASCSKGFHGGGPSMRRRSASIPERLAKVRSSWSSCQVASRQPPSQGGRAHRQKGGRASRRLRSKIRSPSFR